MTKELEVSIVEASASTASPFLKWEQPEDKLFNAPVKTSESAVGLSYLRVELARMRPGMSDFLVRVATPKMNPEDAPKSNVMVTLRGNKAYASPEGVNKMASAIAKQMNARGDATHQWGEADVEHLGKMLLGPLRFFAGSLCSTKLQFATDALA